MRTQFRKFCDDIQKLTLVELTGFLPCRSVSVPYDTDDFSDEDRF